MPSLTRQRGSSEVCPGHRCAVVIARASRQSERDLPTLGNIGTRAIRVLSLVIGTSSCPPQGQGAPGVVRSRLVWSFGGRDGGGLDGGCRSRLNCTRSGRRACWCRRRPSGSP